MHLNTKKKLITLEEAFQLIFSMDVQHSIMELPLSAALNFNLAENIIADRDYPPADRAMMDGFCVKIDDFIDGEATLHYQNQIAAGEKNNGKLISKHATQIMTGGVVSEGADAVVKIENCQIIAQQVQIKEPDLKYNLNIVRKAEYAKKDAVLIEKNSVLSSSAIATCASVGQSKVHVFKKPTVAILSTGNEILPIDTTPELHQIRESNSYALRALCRNIDVDAKHLGIAEDNLEHLQSLIQTGLQNDVFILTGGVSMGKFDLVPQALQEAGVENIFHKVKIKPGKPIWFGKAPSGCLIFALPGNPVSSQVNFKIFVEPMIKKISGQKNFIPNFQWLPLHETVYNPFPLDLFSQSILTTVNQQTGIVPIDIKGSGDFTQLSKSEGFFLCPADQNKLEKGQYTQFLPWK